MKISTQIQILNNKKYYDYLKENSSFIKDLNRHERNFIKFDEYVKEKYTLKISDRINKAINQVDNISNMLNLLK